MSDLAEVLARGMMRLTEDKHGVGTEGYKALGFATREEFEEAGWRNYLDIANYAIQTIVADGGVEADKQGRRASLMRSGLAALASLRMSGKTGVEELMPASFYVRMADVLIEQDDDIIGPAA